MLATASSYLTESGDALNLRVTIDGFKKSEIKVFVESRQVVLVGKRQVSASAKKRSGISHPELLLSVIHLPVDISPKKAVIQFRDGMLIFPKLPKSKETSISAETHAAYTPSRLAAGPQPAEEQARVSEAQPCVIQSKEIGRLIAALAHRGYDVYGPTARDGAIVYDHIESAGDLPKGWTDEQEPAHYRLKRRQDEALFGYVVGPQSLKKYLHPAEVRLLSAERQNGTFRILNNETAPKHPFAFLGVRACELEAAAVQDRVLLEDKCVDPVYKGRRAGVFIVVVQCTQSAKTCFCASMGTGPRAHAGFDLALTELTGDGDHRFVVETGSERGAEVLAELQSATATDADVHQAETAVDSAARQQVRSIGTAGIKELLYQNFEHPRWDRRRRRAAWRAPIAPWSARPASARPWRTSPTLPAIMPNAGGAGIPASRSDSPTSTAAVCAIRPSPLPPVDDAQAGGLDRPVRHAPAASAAAAA